MNDLQHKRTQRQHDEAEAWLEAAEAEIDRLREALERIANPPIELGTEGLRKLARSALNGEDE